MKGLRPLEKGKDSLKSRVLRLLGKNGDFELLLYSKEEKKSIVSELHTHYDFAKELRNATLEAEQDKAMGIGEFQKRRYNR